MRILWTSGCKSEKETMSAERERHPATKVCSPYYDYRHVSGGCSDNFVERFLDDVILIQQQLVLIWSYFEPTFIMYVYKIDSFFERIFIVL
jgi:hypothetical protein